MTLGQNKHRDGFPCWQHLCAVFYSEKQKEKTLWPLQEMSWKLPATSGNTLVTFPSQLLSLAFVVFQLGEWDPQSAHYPVGVCAQPKIM